MKKKDAKELALGIAAMCVRNTYLEDLHAGIAPKSKTKNFSDVKVVTPSGDIPWKDLSRLDDSEMCRLMKEIVNKLYAVLLRIDDPDFAGAVKQYGKLMTFKWDAPKDLKLCGTSKSKNKSRIR